jgi:hypothetical protein
LPTVPACLALGCRTYVGHTALSEIGGTTRPASLVGGLSPKDDLVALGGHYREKSVSAHDMYRLYGGYGSLERITAL